MYVYIHPMSLFLPNSVNVLSYSICVAGLVASGAVVFLAAGMSYFYMGGGE